MTLRDRFLAWRDRRLTDSRFQQKLARYPLVGRLARKKARDAFDLCAGFVYSQVLQACVQLDLLGTVRDSPKTIIALSERLGLPEAGTRRLVLAAESLDLLQARSGNRYGLGETGAALLGNPGVLSMIRHHDLLYRDLADPVETLKARRKDTNLAKYWAYAGDANPRASDEDHVRAYSKLMAETQEFIAAEILDAVDFSGRTHLMDVGGGLGVFLGHVGRAYPELDLTLFDLPSVVAQAEPGSADDDLARRFNKVGGDMFSDALPQGADVISFVRILHDHDDEPVANLLSAARDALAPGGELVVAEPMAGTPGAQPMGHAYFGLYLWAMGTGRPRQAEELRQMLHQAGFQTVRERKTRQPLLTRILIAR